MATYNGSKVALFWAGNADGAPMNRNAFGGTIHANPMKNFFSKLLKNNYITNDLIKPVDVGNVKISKISGKIATATTPSELVVDTMYYLRGVPLSQDDSVETIEYDPYCGAQGQYTSTENLKKGYIISPSTFMPNRMDLNEIVGWWKQSTSFS